jgi:hypothetical protein
MHGVERFNASVSDRRRWADWGRTLDGERRQTMKCLAWLAMIGLVAVPLVVGGCESKPPPEEGPPTITPPAEPPEKGPAMPPPPPPPPPAKE